MALKPAAKNILIVLAIVVACVAAWKFTSSNPDIEAALSGKKTAETAIPGQIDLNAGAPVPAASTTIATTTANMSGNLKMLSIPWSATLGLHLANGDAITTPDSILGRKGVKLDIQVQDDYSVMATELLLFAKGVSKGEDMPKEGAAFVIIMGDGYPGFVAGLEQQLKKIGQSIEVVGALGYSRGEDKFMLPPAVVQDPQAARGMTVAGVPRDGDLHIMFKWASDNNIPINVDTKTWDPNALNIIETKSFTDADDKYIAGYKEERDVVKNGKRTGEKKMVNTDGTATWTPGDVKVTQKKGGLAVIASTKQYIWQMPSVIIGNAAWMAKHPNIVKNILAGALEGGERVRSSESDLLKAGTVAAKVYKEGDGAWWAKYHRGVIEMDRTGQIQVPLGGSTTIGLADNAHLFGLNGNDNLFKRIYTVFGNIDRQYYPNDMPTVVNYDKVVNTTYLQDLLKAASNMAAVDKPVYTSGQATKTFAKKSISIEFASGQATFTSKAVGQLNDLLDQLSVSGLSIQLNGHTDSIGSAEANMTLSKKRADAVKNWLVVNAPSSFSPERISTRGYGDSQPVGDNKTKEGQAANRRTEVLLLQ
jgi:OmpA-OmpF porin, OOP family